MTEIYLMNVSPFEDAAVFLKHYRACIWERRREIDRLRVPAARRRSLGCSVLLMRAMEKRGLGMDGRAILKTPAGKPYLKGGGMCFSMSHSGDYAALAVSDCDVGIDIERHRRVDMMIAERFFAHGEREYIKYSDDRQKAFFEIWTKKESFIKAVGMGMQIPLSSFNVTEKTVNWEGVSYSFSEAYIPGYSLMTCSAGEGCENIVEIVDL